ncbi:hypothetical protein ASE75_04655 [Sphingomonas sp. Leaf17]|uniref:hypothetical protein n=1 Tax=Sphingomonas sp. Leaf17 TaxID=1735683 RepID=UPI0006FC269E|nr:hypothetical protein [Sphingomonas sp. Leaf17]KQM65554.1 hypothetical protein ASE75_04655 [Sphingomonas sp. Leaf17]
MPVTPQLRGPRPNDPPHRGHRVRGPVAGRLLAVHAITPADAVPYTPPDRIARWWLDHHLRTGTIRRLPDGRIHLDLHAHYAHAEARSRRLTPIALVAAIAIAGIAVMFYRG